VLRRTASLLGVLAALSIPAIGPAAAMAADKLPADVQSVVDDFRDDGQITPCKHTAQALERTSKLAPSDIAAYSPDFPAAVEAALEARKKDDCGQATPTPTPASGATGPTSPGEVPPAGSGAVNSAPTPGGHGSTPTPTATPSATPVPTPAATPVPATEATGEPTFVTVAHNDPVPPGLWVLIGLLALSALGWLALVVLGRTGWGEERLAGPRHAWSEARYRAGGVWNDFTDWLRVGR
jgi:hypothetical protein